MTRSFPATFTPALAVHAIRVFLWRQVRVSGLVILAIVLGMAGYLIVRTPYDWAGIVLVGLVIALAGLFWADYLRRRAEVISWLKTFGSQDLRYELTDDSLTVVGPARRMTISWNAIFGLWRSERVWLVFTDRASFLTVPAQGPSAEDLSFISGKIALHDRPIPWAHKRLRPAVGCAPKKS